MTFLPLSRLLAEGRAASHAVALDHKNIIPFDEFRASVMGAADALNGRKRVALTASNSFEFAVGYLAILHAGGDVVLLPNDRESTLKSLSGEFDFLLDDEFFERLCKADGACAPIDPSRATVVFFTSGSTGAPKRVSRRLEALEREAESHHRYWNTGQEIGAVFATVPHHHHYGLMFKILWPLSVGWPFLAETHEFWESLIADLRPHAVVVSSPAHLQRLGGVPAIAPRLRPARILSAGAPLSLGQPMRPRRCSVACQRKYSAAPKREQSRPACNGMATNPGACSRATRFGPIATAG